MFYKLLIILIGIVILFSIDCLYASDLRVDTNINGLTHEEALRLGEIIYRKGILPSGNILTGIVQKDIEIDGTVFTCQSCHLRSGLGSVEGRVISPPINGKRLFNALPFGILDPPEQRSKVPTILKSKDRRPAYTEETLAAAIRYGLNSEGRELDPVMPRYKIDDEDMKILLYYLKNLSSTYSEGVTKKSIRFATIVSEDANENDKEAMLSTLNAYIGSRNINTKSFLVRAKSPFAEEMELSFREIILDIWELKGDPAMWDEQLEIFYKKMPVFAILGGIVNGEWSHIHNFCERKKIPCILPVTDLPVISDSDWYTVYLSKGYYQEGESAARYLNSLKEDFKGLKILQVYRKERRAEAIANAFRDTMKLINNEEIEELVLDFSQIIDDKFWMSLAKNYKNSVLMLWLNSKDLENVEILYRGANIPKLIFVSVRMLNGNVKVIPDNLRTITFFTYPWALPDIRETRLDFLRSWIKARNLKATNYEIVSQVYLLGSLLSEILMHMKRDFYRDRFLEILDMLTDKTNRVIYYPRVSFGPGQRYLVKGCFVVQFFEGENPQIIKKSDWVIY